MKRFRAARLSPYRLHLYLKFSHKAPQAEQSFSLLLFFNGAFLTRAVVRVVNAFFKKPGAVTIQYFRYGWTYLQGRNRGADVGKRLVDRVRGGEAGTDRECSMDIYTHHHV